MGQATRTRVTVGTHFNAWPLAGSLAEATAAQVLVVAAALTPEKKAKSPTAKPQTKRRKLSRAKLLDIAKKHDEATKG